MQVPLAPQWVSLVRGSTQLPSHFTWVAAQTTVQAPPEQTWPEVQAAPAAAPLQSPEAPQWARLVCGSTQAPSHFTWLAAQAMPQTPPAQTRPPPQVTPASPAAQVPVAPQWVMLVSGSTQSPPQVSCPDGQAPGQSAPVHGSDLDDLQPARSSRRTAGTTRMFRMVTPGSLGGAVGSPRGGEGSPRSSCRRVLCHTDG